VKRDRLIVGPALCLPGEFDEILIPKWVQSVGRIQRYESFLRPVDFPTGSIPTEVARVAQFLSLGQVSFTPSQGFFGSGEVDAFLRFPYRPLHRGHKSGQSRLENVIRRADFERFNRHFFAQGSRNKDQGHIRPPLLGDLQGRQPVEGGKGIVCENNSKPPCSSDAMKSVSVSTRVTWQLIPSLASVCRTSSAFFGSSSRYNTQRRFHFFCRSSVNPVIMVKRRAEVMRYLGSYSNRNPRGSGDGALEPEKALLTFVQFHA
jgi:hypothetical protein